MESKQTPKHDPVAIADRILRDAGQAASTKTVKRILQADVPDKR